MRSHAPSHCSPPKAIKEAPRIYKLCLEKDGKGLLQGLGLAAALGKPLEGLLDEVSVDPSSGELIEGKRFTGTDNVDALTNCTNLITVDLKGNSEIKNIDALTSSNDSLNQLTNLNQGSTRVFVCSLSNNKYQNDGGDKLN